MSVEFLGKNITHEYATLSGVVTTQVSIIDHFLKNVPGFGVITGKSTSIEKRDGNKPPNFARIESSPLGFSCINAMGLSNPGARATAEQLSHINIPKDRFLLASIIGGNEKEFREVAENLYPYVDGIEANISCPHAKKEGQAVGQDIDLVEKIVIELKKINRPILLKLSPKFKIEDYVHILKLVDGVTAINTYGPGPFSVDGHTFLSNGVGSISGKPILEMGIEKVLEIRKHFSTLPIIHGGGLSTAEDIRRSKQARANIHGIGSAALLRMSTNEIKEYLSVLNKDVEDGTNYAQDLLKTELDMQLKKIKVVENERLADDLFVLRFDNSIKADAGQFAMLWSPGKEIKPFSIYNDEPFEVLIQKRGCFTKYLSELENGDELYVQYPYGNSPKIGTEKNILLVGGGTGMAALRLFTKKYENTVAVVGVIDGAHLPNMRDWNTRETIIYSNDGSVGTKGNATDNLEQIIATYQPDYILACGPKGMLDEVKRRGSQLLPSENILGSEELRIECGEGGCGKCATEDGLRNCVDGTFI